jgi:hypothetical protein
MVVGLENGQQEISGLWKVIDVIACLTGYEGSMSQGESAIDGRNG